MRWCCGDRLDLAVARLNPDLPGEALADAIEQLVRLRPRGAEVRNNRDVWNLLRDGAKVEVRSSEGRKQTVTVRFVDWDDPSTERLAGGSPVHGDGRPVQDPGGHRRVRQRDPAGVRRVEGAAGRSQARLRRQPHPLSGCDPAVVLVQRGVDPVERGGHEGGVVLGAVGSLRGVEAGVVGGRAAVDVDRDRHPRGVRAGPAAGSGGELHAVPGGAGRADQDPRQEPSGAGREQRPRLAAGHRREPGSAGRVLAHARVGQELLDDLLRPEGAAEGVGPSTRSWS